MSGTELKPCPFCNKPATAYLAFPKFEHGWHVKCEHDDTCIIRQAHGMFACEATEADMAASWNRRALSAAPQPVPAQAVCKTCGETFDLSGEHKCRGLQPAPAVGEDRMRWALQRIAAPHGCGCQPCVGQCRSQEALEIEVDALRDIARAALKREGSTT